MKIKISDIIEMSFDAVLTKVNNNMIIGVDSKICLNSLKDSLFQLEDIYRITNDNNHKEYISQYRVELANLGKAVDYHDYYDVAWIRKGLSDFHKKVDMEIDLTKDSDTFNKVITFLWNAVPGGFTSDRSARFVLSSNKKEVEAVLSTYILKKVKEEKFNGSGLYSLDSSPQTEGLRFHSDFKTLYFNVLEKILKSNEDNEVKINVLRAGIRSANNLDDNKKIILFCAEKLFDFIESKNNNIEESKDYVLNCGYKKGASIFPNFPEMFSRILNKKQKLLKDEPSKVSVYENKEKPNFLFARYKRHLFINDSVKSKVISSESKATITQQAIPYFVKKFLEGSGIESDVGTIEQKCVEVKFNDLEHLIQTKDLIDQLEADLELVVLPIMDNLLKTRSRYPSTAAGAAALGKDTNEHYKSFLIERERYLLNEKLKVDFNKTNINDDDSLSGLSMPLKM